MTFLKLENVSIDVPVYSSDSFSIRKRLLKKGGSVTIRKVLHNINLEVNEGDRVGLYGSNGAGKTSLLRCLTGAYYPTSGKFSRKGTVTSLIDIHMGLDPEASGYDNIKLKLISMGKDYRDSRLINEIIDFSGLQDVIHYPIKTYSSGMGVRLAFSISTSTSSDILLLDEWLSVGDSNFAEKSSSRMSQLANDSSIMVIASHDMDLLRKQCNRIVELSAGTILREERIF